MEAKPIQIMASSASGGGTRKNDDVEEQEESPSMKLVMGIGAGCGTAVIKQGKPLLTAAQADELQRQVVIYKYIEGGVPVPSSLVRPVWKSVVESANGASGIHKRYPSSVGLSKEFENRNVMDPEPERCRRTDGKRWRCRKDVVPGQKYCEQHMHRGCRSRKAASTPQTIPNDTGITRKASGNVDFKIMGTNMTISVVSGSKSISTSMMPKETSGCINAAAITSNVHADTTITTATMSTDKSCNNNKYKSNSADERNGNCGKYVSVKNQINQSNSITNIKNANAATAQGSNFSPRSVLQVQGCDSACVCRSETELELSRCRRTDGKKWRCRRDVVPNEKYCKMHMHRGAKKRMAAYQSSALLNTAVDASTSSWLNPTSISPKNENSSNLNTNLSISISTNPQLQTEDNMNMSDTSISSSSDTTISDTIIPACCDREISS